MCPPAPFQDSRYIYPLYKSRIPPPDPQASARLVPRFPLGPWKGPTLREFLGVLFVRVLFIFPVSGTSRGMLYVPLPSYRNEEARQNHTFPDVPTSMSRTGTLSATSGHAGGGGGAGSSGESRSEMIMTVVTFRLKVWLSVSRLSFEGEICRSNRNMLTLRLGISKAI